jgi:hypothetical protein
MIAGAPRVMMDSPTGEVLVVRVRWEKGVTGFDSGCLIRRSVPRKATMISITTRRKEISAENSTQRDLVLAA